MSSSSSKLTRGKRPTSANSSRAHSGRVSRNANPSNKSSQSSHTTAQKLGWAALSFVAALIVGWLLLTWVGGIMLLIYVDHASRISLLGQILIALITLIFMGALAVIALRCRRRFVLLELHYPLALALALTVLAVLAGFLLGSTLLSQQSIGVMAALAESFSTLFVH